MQCTEIPEQWQSLFKKAGIKKSDLRNPETGVLLFRLRVLSCFACTMLISLTHSQGDLRDTERRAG